MLEELSSKSSSGQRQNYESEERADAVFCKVCLSEPNIKLIINSSPLESCSFSQMSSSASSPLLLTYSASISSSPSLLSLCTCGAFLSLSETQLAIAIMHVLDLCELSCQVLRPSQASDILLSKCASPYTPGSTYSLYQFNLLLLLISDLFLAKNIIHEISSLLLVLPLFSFLF